MRRSLLNTVAFALTLSTGLTLAQQGPADRPPGPNPPGGRDFPGPLIIVLDADKDGTISADELKNAGKALQTLDRNGDGALSPEELRPRMARPEDRAGREGQRTEGRTTGGGPGRAPGGMGGPGQGSTDSVASAPPVGKDAAEEKILAVLNTMDEQRRGMLSVPRDDGRLLRILAENMGAKHVVELGTSHGFSAICFALALRATGGKLTTFEIDAERANLARANFKKAGVESIVTLVEGDAHQEVSKIKEPIDLIFLDADKEGYIDYIEKLLPLVRPGGLIVAHNMSPRQAAPRYVKAITTDPKLETVFVNTGASGIGLTLKKR